MREARVPTFSLSLHRPVHTLLCSVLALGELRPRSRRRIRFLQVLVGGLLTLGVLGMHSLPTPPATEAKSMTMTAELVPVTPVASVSKSGEASEHSPVTSTQTAAATTAAAAAAAACHELGDAGHGGHGDRGADSGDAGCGGHDVLMLCIALVVGIASVLIALGLSSARSWRPLFIAPRWSALLETLPSPQLFAPPWARRDLTCVHRC